MTRKTTKFESSNLTQNPAIFEKIFSQILDLIQHFFLTFLLVYDFFEILRLKNLVFRKRLRILILWIIQELIGHIPNP